MATTVVMTPPTVAVQVLVRWRRQWQPRQYETEEVTLEYGGEVRVPAGPVAQVGAAVAAHERELLAELTKIGDEVMAERLASPDPRGRAAAQPSGWTRR